MYVAYHVNHPWYTAPKQFQFLVGLVTFVLCELGNLSIHLALRDLRPAGSTVRKIPVPTNNLFTLLFNFVSCPNYTYEIGSWIGFTIMTSCLPGKYISEKLLYIFFNISFQYIYIKLSYFFQLDSLLLLVHIK